MELLKVEIPYDDYVSLPQDLKQKMTVVSVENGDYEDDEEWSMLKKRSAQAYKSLKKREFEIREHLNKTK